MADDTPQPRQRLGKDQAQQIAQTFIQKGYSVHQSGDRIIIWRNRKYLAGFYWEKNIGWRLDLRLPAIHSEDDLTTATLAILATEAMSEATREAWKKFSTTKSEKAWRRYLGLMATHFHSLLQGPTDKGD